MNQTARRRAAALAGIVFAFGTGGLASGEDCRIDGPEFIDAGYQQSLALRCDSSFIGFMQLALTPDFKGAYNLPIQRSSDDGDSHLISFEFRTPWDVGTYLDELYVRGFALDGSGNIEETDHFHALVGKVDRVYQSVTEDRGLFALQAEFEQPVDDWREAKYWEGYTGTGYLRWAGKNHYNDDDHGRMTYEIEVTRAGTYAVSLRSFHYGGHENNDVWMRFDDEIFEKVYSSVEGEWTWHSQMENGGKYKAYLDVGVHTFTIAARSEKFSIDRMHVYNTGDYSRGDIEDHTIPDSSHRYE